jgi:acetyl-CoA carboxylase biotin carboxyl carrier protein
MSTPFVIDEKAVERLAEILNQTDLSEIEYEDQGRRIRVKKERTVIHASPSSGISSSSNVPSPVDLVQSTNKNTINSPMVGTAYLAPDPSSVPFVRVGDHVQEGQNIVIIEAMKVMNQIKSPKSGKIISILIQDGQPVEFGTPLFELS